MNRLVGVGLAVAVSLAVLAGLPGLGADGQPAGPSPSLPTAQEFDRTEFAITVHENGSARWTFVHKKSLSNESERQQFQGFAEEFNGGEPPMYDRFVGRAESLTQSGSETTGREMTAQGFEKRAYVNDLGNQGIVELSFRWTNFASVDGDRVVVGDVFEGGLYIASDQQLVVHTSGDLQFDDVDPESDATSGDELSASDSVTWRGERQFADNRPRVVLVPAGSNSGVTPPGGGSPVTLFVGVVVVLLGIGAVVVWRSGALSERWSLPLVGGADDAEATPTSSGSQSGSGGGAVAPQPAVEDEAFLDDHDRVLKLLEENGGRMRQVNIVEETGWSKSKVSMLLSEMEDDEVITKLRVGRENIVSLQGHEPDVAGANDEERERG